MKDFNAWCNEKKSLEQTERRPLSFHEREIWWCSIGLNIGDEQDGKNDLFERPILILKKFNNKIAWVVPMTTKEKSGVYYHSLEHDGKTFSVILSQMRLISAKRFRRFVRKISPHQYALIQDKLIAILRQKP